MERIITLDAKNYDPALPELKRAAVRGIIFIDGKILMVEDSFDEVKLPGGGMEKGENEQETLIREVAEETGYTVIPQSISPFGEVYERRLSLHEPMIWSHTSRIYFCSVEGKPSACDYTPNEKKYGFRPVMLTVDEAIEKNRRMMEHEGEKAWNQREYKTLMLLKAYLEQHPEILA